MATENRRKQISLLLHKRRLPRLWVDSERRRRRGRRGWGGAGPGAPSGSPSATPRAAYLAADRPVSLHHGLSSGAERGLIRTARRLARDGRKREAGSSWSHLTAAPGGVGRLHARRCPRRPTLRPPELSSQVRPAGSGLAPSGRARAGAGAGRQEGQRRAAEKR